MKPVRLIALLSLALLLSLAFLMGCTQRAKDDSKKAANSAADSLEDVAKTIKSVSKTANQVQRISSRIKNIKGVEMAHDHEKWEYKMVPLGDTPVSEEELNNFGRAGWELATRQDSSLIFKRRKVLVISDKPKPEETKQPKETDK